MGDAGGEMLGAIAAVIYEWGDGDNVDPDRMDTAIAHLTQALTDAR